MHVYTQYIHHSHSPPSFPTPSQRTEDSLRSLVMDRIENTSPNSSSDVASRGYHSDRAENTIPRLLFTAITK
jgi:hypothetical protein